MNPLTNPQIGSHCAEGQGFGANANPLYDGMGLKGHPGIDIQCGWASPIEALTSGLVYTVYPVEHPASDGYTAVFVITDTLLETFEFSYGHVSEIDCSIGQQVKTGDVIAKEGNKGEVYSGNTLITLAMQAAGDHDGHHRHYQKRPVKKVRKTDPTKHYLQTAQGIYVNQGFYYEIYDYGNGYNGCINWVDPLFTRQLQKGDTGYDVYLLQKALVLEVGFDPINCIGIFGPITEQFVVKLQAKHGISPTAPRIGPMTLSYLNKTYGQLA